MGEAIKKFVIFIDFKFLAPPPPAPPPVNAAMQVFYKKHVHFHTFLLISGVKSLKKIEMNKKC